MQCQSFLNNTNTSPTSSWPPNFFVIVTLSLLNHTSTWKMRVESHQATPSTNAKHDSHQTSWQQNWWKMHNDTRIITWQSYQQLRRPNWRKWRDSVSPIVRCLLGVWHGPKLSPNPAAFPALIQPKVTAPWFHLRAWFLSSVACIISPKRKERKKIG